MRNVLFLSVATIIGSMVVACASNQAGVKTSYHSQWTTVNANVATATKAAEAVLRDDNLMDVKSSSTRLDGKATGKKADGTPVKVAIDRKSDTQSEVSVTVGTVGDPEIGADIAKRIKDRAENGGGTTQPAMKM